jgi:hypothetical protein
VTKEMHQASIYNTFVRWSSNTRKHSGVSNFNEQDKD